jgi:hypothetical protein
MSTNKEKKKKYCAAIKGKAASIKTNVLRGITDSKYAKGRKIYGTEFLFPLLLFFLTLLLLPSIADHTFRMRYFVLVLLSVILLSLGFLLSYIIHGRSILSNFSSSQDLTIIQTFVHIIKENSLETALFVIFTVLAIIFSYITNLPKKIEDLLSIQFVPVVMAGLITLASIIITIIGMYYAFLAERKSAQTLKNSSDLLNERADFLEHFSGFINRINRKIEGPGGMIEDVSNEQKSEKHYFFIKCMFLTPFLGHAGITEKNIEMFQSYMKLQKNMERLINNPFCEVKILTLKPKEIVGWYTQIQWIEQVKEEMKEKKHIKPEDSFFKHLENDKTVIINRVREVIINKKGCGPLLIKDENKVVCGPVASFTELCEFYRKHFKGSKLEICHADYIPYQLFLVTKPVIENPRKFPDSDSFKLDDNKEIVENGRFVVLSYVGDRTYLELIKDIVNNSYPILKDRGGIDDLLNKLHSAFYSEDPRVCNILNNHFKHYWDYGGPDKTNLHYPVVGKDLWEIDISGYLPDGCR